MTDPGIMESCTRLGSDFGLEVVEVSGSDAEQFLQRMISCDLHRVLEGAGLRGTLLDSKAKILAYFDIYRQSDQFLLVVEEPMHAGLISHLDRLVILEDVKISSGQRGVISIQGPNAPTLVEQITTLRPVQFLQTASWRGGLVVARTRSPEAGVDLILPLELIDEIEQRLDQEGVVTSSPEATERARIESGFPRSGQDVTERSMPPEVGLDDAISYDKGCYAGQEVLARIRTYGHVNRQLRRIEFQFPEGISTSSIAPGDALHSSDGEGKSAGKITSVARSENGISLMASVRKNHIDEGTVLCWQGVSDDGSSLKLSGEVRFPFRP